MSNNAVSPRRYSDALASLRRAQKPALGTAAYSRFVNRPLGRRVAAAVHVLGMTPNQATVISASLSGLGIALLAVVRPGPVLAVAVALTLAAGYVMDSVDGQLARLRGGGSKSGEWLDHTIDCVKTSSLHLAVLVSWYRFPAFDLPALLLVPIGFEIAAVTTYFGLILMPTLRPSAVAASAAAPVVQENPWRKWLLLPVDYGVLCWSFLLLAWLPAFQVGYTLLFGASAAALVLALRKWWRELRALDAQLQRVD